MEFLPVIFALAGFTNSSNGTRENVDECASDPGPCDARAGCIDTDGSFKCGACPPETTAGMSADGTRQVCKGEFATSICTEPDCASAAAAAAAAATTAEVFAGGPQRSAVPAMKVVLSLAAFATSALVQDCTYDGTDAGVVDVQDLLDLLGVFGCGEDDGWSYIGYFRDNECDISDCDSDSSLDADGTASLCASGQGNCGNRNAVDLDDWTPIVYSQDDIDAAGIENADLAYAVISAAIVLDASLADWAGLPTLAQTPFRRGATAGADANGATGGGDWCEFDAYGGGIHNGIGDQDMSFALAFDSTSLYMGLKTIDDTHQNAGIGWNGDTLQIAFTNAARDTPGGDMILYNYGLHDDGESVTLHHERHPCPDADDCTEAAMARFEGSSMTVYEIQIPAHGLGVDSLTDGMVMGFGMCVNDGDTEDGQGGQKGWTGWGAYSIVSGKNSAATGLIAITGDSVELPVADPQACGSPGAGNLAEPGPGHVLADGEEVTYEQGSTNYVNCVWTSGCDGGIGSIEVISFLSEGNWDFLNIFSDVGLVTNSIGPAANNGGGDNFGDLGRFSGTDEPGSIDYIEAGSNVAFTHTCGAAWSYIGCFRDNAIGCDLTGTGSQGVAQVPFDAANECSVLCKSFMYFGLQWVNECFCANSYNNGFGNDGNQGDCPDGECPIEHCDSDGTLDADGTADLCQGNCGNRNAVYSNSDVPSVINLHQLDGVTATAGPGVNDRDNPGAVIDMDHSPGSWVDSPTADFGDCTESVYMTIDLGDLYMVNGVTIWHYYGNDRAYCQQKICVSATGLFGGEGYCPFDTGEENGPTESEDGNAFTFPPTVAQYRLTTLKTDDAAEDREDKCRFPHACSVGEAQILRGTQTRKHTDTHTHRERKTHTHTQELGDCSLEEGLLMLLSSLR
eukprot:SAG22_NODE_645_length_8202_cov_5.985684_3_plen_906_part_00